MAVIFGLLFAVSLFSQLMAANQLFYIGGFVYSVAAIFLFFRLKMDSLAGQLLIYLSMSLLFLFGCLLSQKSPESSAVSFIVFLLVMPMFMIDKPFFMAFELSAASAVFLIWMHGVKPLRSLAV